MAALTSKARASEPMVSMRDRYTVPADLKSWLRLRDETCRFPGCARRAQRCDIDHVTDWATGGTTDHTNLIHLCRTHHRLKHHTTWTAQIITDLPGSPGRGESDGPSRTGRTGKPGEPTGPQGARVHWTAPSGRTYTTDDAIHHERDTDEYDVGSDSGHPDQQGSPPGKPPGQGTRA